MGDATTRPEELMNSLLKLRTATRNIANGLGVLALLWSTVVLLGGFVSVLRLKEFWVLTGMSFLMGSRMLDFVDNEIFGGGQAIGEDMFGVGLAGWLIYVEEARIVRILWRLRIGRRCNLQLLDWRRLCRALVLQPANFAMVLVAKVLCICPLLPLYYAPFAILGVSVWRLVQRDYGDAGGDAANIAKLAAALDIFYALVLFMSLFVTYWVFLVMASDQSVSTVESLLTNKQPGCEKWIRKLAQMYYRETRRKFNKDGELPGNWNLITYAVGLLQSASTGDGDHQWGARLLDTLFDEDASVRQELLSSRSSIQNLIGMIGRRGVADNIEKRERAARIVARHLAGDLQITHFPGTLQCICSLLESSWNKFCEPQVTCCPSSELINPDEQSRSQLQTSVHQHDDAHISVPIQDKTAGSAQSERTTFLFFEIRTTFLQRLKKSREQRQQHDKDIKERRRYTYTSTGVKELISQGLLILEGLTQDEENCTEIMKHQRLLSKIISPLSSSDFLSSVREDAMVEMLGKSFTVVSRLLTCPGDGATRLRQELATSTEAVRNLMVILKADSEGARQLHQQALEILTELAFDDSFKKLEFNKLFKTLLRIFLKEAPSNNTVVQVEQADRGKATRLRGIAAGEAVRNRMPVSLRGGGGELGNLKP